MDLFLLIFFLLCLAGVVLAVWKKRYGWHSMVFFAIFLMLCLMIFGFSAQNGEESGGLSDRVAGMIAAVIRAVSGRKIPVERLSFPVRKAAHMTEYALLWLDCFGMLLSGRRYRRDRSVAGEAGMHASSGDADDASGSLPEYMLTAGSDVWLASMATCLVVSASDEIHQRFVPGRAGQLIDVGWDMLGAGICLVLVRFVYLPLIQTIRRRPSDPDRTSCVLTSRHTGGTFSGRRFPGDNNG